MEKLVYVCWKRDGVSDHDWSAAIVRDLVPTLHAAGARGVRVTVPDEHTDAVRATAIANREPRLSGTVSVWLPACDERAGAEAALREHTSAIAGYLVTESVVLDDGHPLSTPDDLHPAVDLQGFLAPAAGMDHADFVEHWFEEHRAVALETECVTSYERNLVARRLTPGAPAWAGIVDQHFPSVDVMLDPVVRFNGHGDESVSHANLVRMVNSCVAFLDMTALDSHPLTEYRFADPA